MVDRPLSTRAMRAEALEKDLEDIDKAKNEPVKTEDENLSVDEKRWKKRHDDNKSYMQKQINALQKDKEILQAQLQDAAAKQIKFPKTEEEVAEWVKKYPDVAAIVETIAMKKVADVRQEVAEAKAQNAARAYEVEFDRCTNKIVAAHDDFFELQNDEKFLEWLQKQPKYIRSVFDSDEPIPFSDLEDAADTAILALRMFKADTKPAPAEPKKDNRRDAARDVIRNSPSAPMEHNEDTWLESDIAAMHIKEYEKHEKEILQAMRENRIVYDISGAAR